MKIYTKTGDKGETSLFGGTRVAKHALRIEAYGTVDELNSILGVCRSINTIRDVDAILEELQRDLFTLGADLATPRESSSQDIQRIASSDAERLERHIDAIESTFEPLKNFILPGGSTAAAMLHFARTVCRRAERLIVRLSTEERIGDHPTIYLNRCSDLLFMMARWVNHLGDTPETTWKP
jgi:cob(I)alamin adenosyltransferase